MVYFIVRGNLFVILLFRGLKMMMSNGSKIRFWEYLWLAVFSSVFLFPHLYWMSTIILWWCVVLARNVCVI